MTNPGLVSTRTDRTAGTGDKQLEAQHVPGHTYQLSARIEADLCSGRRGSRKRDMTVGPSTDLGSAHRRGMARVPTEGEMPMTSCLRRARWASSKPGARESKQKAVNASENSASRWGAGWKVTVGVSQASGERRLVGLALPWRGGRGRVRSRRSPSEERLASLAGRSHLTETEPLGSESEPNG
jgi:hypothetical protein